MGCGGLVGCTGGGWEGGLGGWSIVGLGLFGLKVWVGVFELFMFGGGGG